MVTDDKVPRGKHDRFNKIDCNEKSIITLNQIHSNNVVHLEKENYLKRKLSGDAIITQKKNIAIAVLTADCVPILFYDSKKKIIGCIHSGWKGGLNGIIEKTINKLNALNCNVRDLNFAIGPCIGKKDYEVGFDFYEKFIAKSANNDFFFEKKSETKYFFDSRAFINSKLLSLNIKNIDNLTMNTFSDEKNFYSYRRSCLNNEKDYGRCISVILMT